MKQKTEQDNAKRTPIEKFGKMTALEILFKDTGYKNSTVQYYGKENCKYVSYTGMLLEGVDFDLVYNPLRHLGYKAVLNSVGPIYASFYKPVSLSVNLGLSARFCFEDLLKLWIGIVAAAKEHKIEKLSLDINSSLTGLSISISATGEQEEKVLATIPPVSSNSILCLTGDIGAAFMGFNVLEREKIAFQKLTREEIKTYKQPDLSKYKYIMSKYLAPDIDPDMIDQFLQAGIFPSKGYFISRGLADAVKRLASDYECGVKIFLDKIPIASQTMEMAAEINVDAVTAAMNGGDDYRFLFVIPLDKHEEFHREFPNVDLIGHICKKEVGTLLITPEGNPMNIRAQGWK
ncbi:MAG: hypothetical protein LKI53_00725 [Bacteroidales bacterium]|jgi:thiamine-monophosphate kinase|nr:hypothetical protein [Bacteroidales bacterium]